MSKKKVLLRGVFINRDTNGEGVLKVGTTLIRVSTVMGILYIKLTVIGQGPGEGSAKIEDGEIIGTSQGWVAIEASLEGCEPIQFWLYFNDGSYN